MEARHQYSFQSTQGKQMQGTQLRHDKMQNGEKGHNLYTKL